MNEILEYKQLFEKALESLKENAIDTLPDNLMYDDEDTALVEIIRLAELMVKFNAPNMFNENKKMFDELHVLYMWNVWSSSNPWLHGLLIDNLKKTHTCWLNSFTNKYLTHFEN